MYFLFDLTNDRQYWLSPSEVNGTIYVFDTSTTVYTVNFFDLAGALDDYPYVEAKRYVNGTLHIVEKRKVDKEKKDGEKYTIVIKDGAYYTFGDVAMTSTTSVSLTIKGVWFPQDIILAYRYVRAYAYRENATTVRTMYADTKNNTNSVTIKIYYENGTVAYTSSYGVGNNTVSDTWNSANASLNYYEVVAISHGDYGSMEFRVPLPRSWSESPWGLDALGQLPFGIDTSTLIPAIILVGVMLSFSVFTAGVGGIIVCALASFMAYRGWINIDVNVLLMAWALAILFAIIHARKRVTVR